METGVVNEESLSNVLRSISQRKKNGVLEIAVAQETVSILFAKGKVVDVRSGTESPAAGVVRRLKAAGWVPADAREDFQSYAEAFDAFSVMEMPRGPLPAELFRRVVKHYVLDQLYSIDMGGVAYYTFKVQMVESDPEFAPSISSGQILLDLVSLKQDEARFAATFPPEQPIKCTEDASGLSEEEESIWQEISATALSVEQVRCVAMLSRFHLQEALLAMHERGVVQCVTVEAPAPNLAEAAAELESPHVDEMEPELSAQEYQRNVHLSSYHTLHNKLLQDVRIPHFLMVILLVVGTLGPLILWKGVWGEF